MTLAQHGLYLNLLFIQWEDGYIKDDPALYARMFGENPKRMAEIWPDVRACFDEIEPGKLRQARMHQDREDTIALCAKNKENGGKGGRPKKTKEEPKPNRTETDRKPNGYESVNRNKTETKPIPKPEPYTDPEIGEKRKQELIAAHERGTPPTHLPEVIGTPFVEVELTLKELAIGLGQPPPSALDCRNLLGSNSPLLALLRELGGGPGARSAAAALYLKAHSEWEGRVSWKAVYAKRHELMGTVTRPPAKGGGMEGTRARVADGIDRMNKAMGGGF